MHDFEPITSYGDPIEDQAIPSLKNLHNQNPQGRWAPHIPLNKFEVLVVLKTHISPKIVISTSSQTQLPNVASKKTPHQE